MTHYFYRRFFMSHWLIPLNQSPDFEALRSPLGLLRLPSVPLQTSPDPSSPFRFSPVSFCPIRYPPTPFGLLGLPSILYGLLRSPSVSFGPPSAPSGPLRSPPFSVLFLPVLFEICRRYDVTPIVNFDSKARLCGGAAWRRVFSV